VPGRRAGIVLLVAAALAGCGGSDAPGLEAGQQKGLLAQLEAVRASAAAGDVSGTEQALHSFRASVARLRRSGELTAAQARQLRLGAVRILARVKEDNAPPPQPVQTQTAPAPAPPGPPGQTKKKHDKKDKHAKPGKGGHGKGGRED
jgi:hypothetical protein